MKFSKIFEKFAAAALVAITCGAASNAQSVDKPRQETLLNGLKVLIWNQPTGDTVSVSLRVHAGSSFDPQGKEGTMRMLSEAIFPSDESRQFEDLGGNIEIVSNYDYIQLNATVRSDGYVNLLETLATAVSNPLLDKETADQVRLRVNLEGDRRAAEPAYIADRLASQRLFGSFPYGRPAIGTTESRAKIDFADLRFAYARFFGADNATLTIRGPVDSDLAYRAARRFFGSWLKSDKKVPSTFKQPEFPDTSLEVLNLGSDQGAEVRHIIRGFSRADTDFPASEILTRILDARLKRRAAIDPNAYAEVRNEAHILPGQVVFAVSRISTDAKTKLYPAGASVDAKGLIPTMLSEPITDAEFQAARSAAMAGLRSLSPEMIWLDSETYRITPAASQIKKLEAVTLAEVQKLAAALKNRPAVNLWLVKGIGAS